MINHISRVAVPFFFLASGYLLAEKLKPGVLNVVVLKRYSKRVVTILVFWSAVYFLIPPTISTMTPQDYVQFVSSNTSWIIGHPIDFMMHGTKYHLWFLVSLLLAVWIVALQLALGFDRGILLTGALFFVAGLLAGPYFSAPIGFNMHFNTRHGPFFSTLFVAIGWWVGKSAYRPKPVPALMLIFFGFCLQLGEGFFLYKAYGRWFTWHDYLVGTLLFGTGALLLALSKPDLFSSTILPRLGRYTLGIYASHILFVEMLRPVGEALSTPLWDIGFPVAVFLSSLCLASQLSRFSILRPLVV